MKAKTPKTESRKFRAAPRKTVTPIQVSSVSSMENLSKLARSAEIVDASSTGFLVIVKREDLVPVNLRRNLTLDSLVGTRVLLQLAQMNIQVSGKVVRWKLVGKSGFELGVDYSDDAPDYWRECLVELLPAPGEID